MKSSALVQPNPVPARPSHSDDEITSAISFASASVSALWPLRDFVAVNPLEGLTDHKFLDARNQLRSFSDAETLMPVAHYRERFQQGFLLRSDIEAAVAEFSSEFPAFPLAQEEVMATLTGDWEATRTGNPERRLESAAELSDRSKQSNWTEMVRNEIGKFCGDHYDLAVSAWPKAGDESSLYGYWKSTATIDRSAEMAGLSGFRQLVCELPEDSREALLWMLNRLQVPQLLWSHYLACLVHSIPGWSAFAAYQGQMDDRHGVVKRNDFIGLLAIRLAYDFAIFQKEAVTVDWLSTLANWEGKSTAEDFVEARQDALVRFALLRASEYAYLREMKIALGNAARQGKPEISAQMVFCIDVRSERFRRRLENTDQSVETFGFAGFFGLPLALKDAETGESQPQCPAILPPSTEVTLDAREHAVNPLKTTINSALTGKSTSAWSRFKDSAIGGFGFVETTGLIHMGKMFFRLFPRNPGHSPQDRRELLYAANIEDRVELAGQILAGIGLTEKQARLVVLCGHGSTTANNPLQAGLDCGACCGHSGAPNARLAVQLLNNPDVREGLRKKGIEVPETTRFLAAHHHTVTDEIEFLDENDVPATHRQDLERLKQTTREASMRTRSERAVLLGLESDSGFEQRQYDWSETRPEWGLAGNAAFIIAPREMTAGANLDGRTFLHSYDHRKDPELKVLEQIVGGPLMVTHMINAQYMFSTVDNERFGSGSKTIHNVVGGFGVFSGNGGDLKSGLPIQSLSGPDGLQHEPLRLHAILAAPREDISIVLERTPGIRQLALNGWIHLFAWEGGEFYRLTSKGEWLLNTGNPTEYESTFGDSTKQTNEKSVGA